MYRDVVSEFLSHHRGKTVCSINTYTRRHPGEILSAASGLMADGEFASKADASPSALVTGAE